MKLINTESNQALLIDAISEVYRIPIELLNSPFRLREVAIARQMMFKIAYDHFGMTYSEIGRTLPPEKKNFHHTTIIHAKQTIDGLLKVKDDNTVAKYNAVMSYISERLKIDATITINLAKEDVRMVLNFLNDNKLEYNVTMKVQ